VRVQVAIMTNSKMNMMRMMKGCRFCALMPITFGAILFILGYFLDAETVRLLWLIFTGFMVVMGVFMLIIGSAFFR
jgi:hypothetical protein